MTTPTPLRRGPGRPAKYPVTPIVPELPALPPQPIDPLPLCERHCLTMREAAAYVGLSDVTLRKEIAAGRVVVRYYGRKPLVLRTSLEAFVADLLDHAEPERSA